MMTIKKISSAAKKWAPREWLFAVNLAPFLSSVVKAAWCIYMVCFHQSADYSTGYPIQLYVINQAGGGRWASLTPCWKLFRRNVVGHSVRYLRLSWQFFSDSPGLGKWQIRILGASSMSSAMMYFFDIVGNSLIGNHTQNKGTAFRVALLPCTSGTGD